MTSEPPRPPGQRPSDTSEAPLTTSNEQRLIISGLLTFMIYEPQGTLPSAPSFCYLIFCDKKQKAGLTYVDKCLN